MGKKKSGKTRILAVMLIAVIGVGAFIAYNDVLISGITIPNLDEDHENQIVTTKGEVSAVVDIIILTTHIEGFVIKDAANNAIYVDCDGDQPAIGDHVVVVGNLSRILTSYFITQSAWRPILIFR